MSLCRLVNVAEKWTNLPADTYTVEEKDVPRFKKNVSGVKVNKNATVSLPGTPIKAAQVTINGKTLAEENKNNSHKKPQKTKVSSSRTGDEVPLGLAWAELILSALALAVIVLRSRRNHDRADGTQKD